tara:strand:+ start:308 stop:481 length:174 start_codon:yes stop_codon:yes gene_type:complete
MLLANSLNTDWRNSVACFACFSERASLATAVLITAVDVINAAAIPNATFFIADIMLP